MLTLPCTVTNQYEVGFLTTSRTEEDSNPAIKNANCLIRQLGIGQIKSYDQRVTKWALFERFVLENNLTAPWAIWLKSLPIRGEEPASTHELDSLANNRVIFQPPTDGLVKQHMASLRFGTDYCNSGNLVPLEDAKLQHKGGTIRVYVSAIDATCKEFNVTDPTKTDEIKNIVNNFIDVDGYDQTAAFDCKHDVAP